jgi:hypothetical protein
MNDEYLDEYAKENTGKFGQEVVEDYEEEEPHPPVERQLASLEHRRNQEKITKNDQSDVKDQNDESAGEIESILMKNKSGEKKPQQRKHREWTKNSKKIQSVNPDIGIESNARNYFEAVEPIEQRKMWDRQMNEEFDDLDLMAQTPKPNTKYPVPSRENEYGEASFGSQAKQYQRMKEKSNEEDCQSTRIEDSKLSGNVSPGKFNSSIKEEMTSDSKANLKSRIPTIGKTNSRTDRRMMGTKQIRSFVDEQTEDLDGKIQHKPRNDHLSPHNTKIK